MILRNCLIAAALLALPAGLSPSLAQTNGYLTAVTPAKVVGRRGETVEARVVLQVRNGFHINSNAPNEDYLIPLRLKWEPGALGSPEIVFPKPEQKNYSFSAKPVSVFTGEFQVVTKFKVEGNAPGGLGMLVGKLRYQACSDDTCYRPAVVEIRLPYEIH